MNDIKKNIFSGVKVLVIDDSDVILAIIAKMGQMRGAQVITSKLPSEVDDLLKTHQPDFLILDQMFADTTGTEIVTRLRKNPDYDDIPIVLLTASEDPELALHAIYVGADDFIDKANFQKVLFPKMLAMVRLREKNRKIIQLKELKAIHAVIGTVKHEFGNLLSKINFYLMRLQKSSLGNEDLGSVSKVASIVKEQGDLLKKLNDIDKPEMEPYSDKAQVLKVK